MGVSPFSYIKLYNFIPYSKNCGKIKLTTKKLYVKK